MKRVSQALKDISTSLEELEARVASMQHEQEVMKQKQRVVDTRVVNVEREQEVMKLEQSSLSDKMDTLETSTQVQLESLKSQQEDMQQRVANVEEKRYSAFENRGKYSERFIRLRYMFPYL